MGLIWFLSFLALLSTSSFAELQESKSSGNHTTIQLNLYHSHGPSSSLTPNSSLSLYDLLSHDQDRTNSLIGTILRNTTATATSLSSTPLISGYSIGSGNYYIKLGLGSPPKYYPMILDTGSSFSWLQCNPCVVYCHRQAGPLFEPSASSSYTTLSCESPECSSLKSATLNDPACTTSGKCVYTASYGDTSYSMGYLSQDLLTFTKSQTLPRFTYGCGQDNEGSFGGAAGIVGLARDKLSMLAQLSERYGYKFSYCLPTASSSSGSGFLSIGRISPTPYKFTPLIRDRQNPSLYFLRFKKITVAGKRIKLGASGYKVATIIDSGTVITRLPNAMYSALSGAFVKHMSKRYKRAPGISILDTCFEGSLKSIMSGVPEIELVFRRGARLNVGASNSLIEVGNATCLAFARSNQVAIIGNYQQQTYSVYYDVSESKIGFASGGCR